MRICNKTLNSAGKNSTFQTGLKAEEPCKRNKVASSQNIHYQLWLYLTHILHTKDKLFSIYTTGMLPRLPADGEKDQCPVPPAHHHPAPSDWQGAMAPEALTAFSQVSVVENKNSSKHRPANSWGCFTGFVVITFFHKALATINLLFIAWGSQLCLAQWFS